MSETYTVGGDTLSELKDPNYIGQTFRPVETHTLEYIDLQVRVTNAKTNIPIRVYHAGIDHKPAGPILSAGSIPAPSADLIGKTTRLRAKMSPYSLVKRQYYALVAWSRPFPSFMPHYLLYDKDDATYPRGMRISSPDHGATWTAHFNDDLIFTEFGNPPLPTPEPPPPIENFATMNVNYPHFATATKIMLATSVPCHLSCYYTDKKPLKHHTSRIVRGLPVPWATYFCFVAWTAVEQNEPGDTLYHTFDITPWQYCQTKWLTFRGTVDEVISPSVGPIFEHHHSGQDLILNPSFEVWTNPAGHAPDHWEYPPAPHHGVMYRDPVIKTHLLYSCRLDNPVAYGNFRIQQNLDLAFFSGLSVTFTLAYRGKATNFNWFRIRAIGDTSYWKYAYPTLDYQWEDLVISATLPTNLTTLYLQAQNMNQGDPVPFQTWWDNCRVDLTP